MTTFTTTFTDDDKAVLLLTTRLAGKEAPALSPGMWWEAARVVRDAGEAPRTLLTDSLDGSLPAEMAERLSALRRMGGGLDLALDSLASRGIVAVPVSHDSFPGRLRARLGNACPPVLFVAGNVGDLDAGGLGIVGSRDVSPAGAEVASVAARLAARRGVQVVSGAARGVDQVAMGAAADSGGAIIGFIADSLTGRVRDGSVRGLIGDGSLVLASVQLPDAGFSVGSAMGRNKLIYAAADATLVVASDLDSGGTWAGAVEAIKSGFGTVLVWVGDGSGPGNAALVERGATAVEDLEGLFGAWPPTPAPSQEVDQGRLF